MGVDVLVASKQDVKQKVVDYLRSVGPALKCDVDPYERFAARTIDISDFLEQAAVSLPRRSLPQDPLLVRFPDLMDEAGFRRAYDIAFVFRLDPIDARHVLDQCVQEDKARLVRYKGKDFFIGWQSDLIDEDAYWARKDEDGWPDVRISYLRPGPYARWLERIIPGVVTDSMNGVGCWVSALMTDMLAQNRPYLARYVKPFCLPNWARDTQSVRF